jgi:2-polyprenyl-6-methoxyphenol hydroxylase-like FAD-dependent oxidoreductase
MALEDALILAESLVGADSLAEALTVFELRRQPRIAWVRRHTHRRDRVRHPVAADP